MKFLSRLGEHDDLALLGGKAGHLARLLRAGLPVPPGFVVESGAFAALGPALSGPARPEAGPERRAALLATTLPEGLPDELAAAFGELRAPLIVRSSALGEDSGSASFAGQLDSIFPVTSLEELTAALRRCWASYFSDRCLAYQASGRGQLAGMAVLVQELVPAAFSGVLFTRDGALGGAMREDSMLGEFCAGYGEALVSGRVDPGRFTLSREAEGQIRFEVRLPESPEESTLAELGRLALVCEGLFGAPQDIEWTIDGDGQLFLLQSRPLTVAGPPPAAAYRPFPPSGKRVLWSNANVNENFPAPISPLLYSVAATGYNHYFLNLARAFGVSSARLQRLQPAFAQIIGVHGGRMYYHLSHIHQILRGVPGGEFLSRSFDDFVGSEGGKAETPAPPTRVYEVLRMATRVFGQYRNVRARVSGFEKRIDTFCDDYPIPELSHRSAAELRQGLLRFLEIRRHRWNDAALADAGAMVTYGLLGRVLRRLFPDDPGLLHDLLKGLPDLVSGHPPRDLWRVAQLIESQPQARELFRAGTLPQILATLREDPQLATVAAAFAEYQKRWGFRCSGELMLTQPGFDEKPEGLIDLLRAYLGRGGQPPEVQLAEQERLRLKRTASLLGALRGRRRLLRLPLRALLRATHVSIELRERARLKQARLYHRLRHLALAIGRGFVGEGRLERVEDVFYFTIEELAELLAGGAMFAGFTGELAASRRLVHEELGKEVAPDQMVLAEGASWLGGEERDIRDIRDIRDKEEEEDSSSEVLFVPDVPFVPFFHQGTGASSGKAEGLPRYLREVSEAALLEPGEILFTRQTDPGWAAIFPLISGLVLERGGLLSHGAILAREYGIPCVVGIRDAANIASLGKKVRVDGNRGTVDVL